MIVRNSYPLLDLLQEGEGVDILSGSYGGDPQFEAGVLYLGDDRIHFSLGQLRQNAIDGL